MIWALGGFLAGGTHVLAGPDHLAAVAPLAVANGKSPWRYGLMWGLGHSGGAWGLGLLAVFLGQALPLDALSTWSERLVAVTLIGIGLWGVQRTFRTRVARPQETPLRHPTARPAAFAVGLLHGLAGGSHLLGVLPALALPAPWASFTYLAGFGLGSVVAMVAYAWLLGWAAGMRPSQPRIRQALLGASSVVALTVGGVWLIF